MRAVESALEQPLSTDEHEIIVVNDTGRPLPPASWQEAPNVRIVPTNCHNRSIARNTGAAIATGRFLHFLDDDDWLLPDGLHQLRQLSRETPSADWIAGGSQLVTRRGEPILKLDHQMQGNCFVQVMSGEWIPLQSSLIRAEAFFAVGGFRPRTLASQDVDLCRRIMLNGDLASLGECVACIEMGEEGSSTDNENRDAYSREAREAILNLDRVWRRLVDSADGAGWSGRIARIYVTSAVWNLQHGRGWTAVSRLIFGLAGLVRAGTDLFSPRFWEALTHRYESESFARGQQLASMGGRDCAATRRTG